MKAFAGRLSTLWLKGLPSAQGAEQGDYNLRYLLDGQVGPAQLTLERIQAPDAQAMVARIECLPDAQLTARFPQELSARITVRTKDGRELVVEHIGYEGGLDKPMSWDRVLEKFHWLSEANADQQLRSRIIAAVQEIDSRPIFAPHGPSGPGAAQRGLSYHSRRHLTCRLLKGDIT